MQEMYKFKENLINENNNISLEKSNEIIVKSNKETSLKNKDINIANENSNLKDIISLKNSIIDKFLNERITLKNKDTLKDVWDLLIFQDNSSNIVDFLINNEHKIILKKLIKMENTPKNLEKLEKYCMEELKLNRNEILKITEVDDFVPVTMSLLLVACINTFLLISMNMANISKFLITFSVIGVTSIIFVLYHLNMKNHIKNTRGLFLNLKENILERKQKIINKIEEENVSILENKYLNY